MDQLHRVLLRSNGACSIPGTGFSRLCSEFCIEVDLNRLLAFRPNRFSRPMTNGQAGICIAQVIDMPRWNSFQEEGVSTPAETASYGQNGQEPRSEERRAATAWRS